MNKLRLSELLGLSDAEFTKRVREFAASRFQPSDAMKELDERISAFETMYKMSSETMKGLLRERELKETQDICVWCMLLSLREDCK